MREIKTNIKNPKLVEKRRNQILKVAVGLFRKNGYHATTMREICEKANVNLGSFYNYFGSKKDILVYIYKSMMYYRGVFGKTFPKIKISSWDDLESFLRDMILPSLGRHKHPIQLLYRETISLDKKTLREVLQIESDYIRWVAENLREGLGLPSTNSKLELLANLVVYINSFIPLRGWNLHHLEQEEIVDFAVDVLMTKLKELCPESRKAEMITQESRIPTWYETMKTNQP